MESRWSGIFDIIIEFLPAGGDSATGGSRLGGSSTSLWFNYDIHIEFDAHYTLCKVLCQVNYLGRKGHPQAPRAPPRGQGAWRGDGKSIRDKGEDK